MNKDIAQVVVKLVSQVLLFVGALNSEGTMMEISRFGLPPLASGGLETSSGGKKRKTSSKKSPFWA